MIQFTSDAAPQLTATLADDSAVIMLRVLGYSKQEMNRRHAAAEDFLGRALVGLWAQDQMAPQEGFDPARTCARLRQFADLALAAKAAGCDVRWSYVPEPVQP